MTEPNCMLLYVIIARTRKAAALILMSTFQMEMRLKYICDKYIQVKKVAESKQAIDTRMEMLAALLVVSYE